MIVLFHDQRPIQRGTQYHLDHLSYDEFVTISTRILPEDDIEIVHTVEGGNHHYYVTDKHLDKMFF